MSTALGRLQDLPADYLAAILRFDQRTVGKRLSLQGEFDCVEVLALVARFRVIGTGASLSHQVHLVNLLARLTRDQPAFQRLVQLAQGRNHKAAFFSGVHHWFHSSWFI